MTTLDLPSLLAEAAEAEARAQRFTEHDMHLLTWWVDTATSADVHMALDHDVPRLCAIIRLLAQRVGEEE